MNKNLLDYIQHLSKEDEKTILQKALKTCEETGELARAVLPYLNSPSTLHRFADKEDILEEAADVILCALSVAYNLGMDHDEIEAMMYKKSDKWASLQAREKQIKFPLPFEIHITIKESNKDAFIQACKELEVKPIFLDLQDKSANNVVLKDVMTSSKFLGNNLEVYEEMLRISNGLRNKNFEVIREKIETVPWHPAAPSKSNGVSEMPKGGYFECHIGVILDNTRKEHLGNVAKSYNLHMSRNIMKKIDDNTSKQMLTYRLYDGVYEDFKEDINAIKNRLNQDSFQFEKEIIEFAVYDTKISHDKSWIK